MFDAGALLLILAVAFPPQEGQEPPGPEPEWVGPRAPTRSEREAAEEARRVREERAKRANAASARLALHEAPLAALWVAGRPSLSRQRGLPPLDLAPLKLGEDARRTWRRGLQKSKGELEGIDWPALDAPRRLDRDWLSAFLETELALDALAPERGNPLGILEELAAVLSGVLAAGGLEADPRMRILTVHLSGLPAILLATKGELVHPDRDACEQGLLAADDLLLFLRTRMTPRLAAARPAPALWEPFEEAQAAAEHAVLDFRAWLAEEAKRGGAPRVLGARAWLHVAGALVGGDLEVEALKVRLLRDIATLDASLAGLDAPPAAAADLAPAAVADRLRGAQLAAWISARDLRLVSEPPPPVGCALWTAGTLPGAPVELHFGERPVLVVVPRGAAWSESTGARRLAELSPAGQRAGALALGFPGQALWELWARKSPRVTQRVFWNRAQREGFGLWAADWATRPARAPSALAGDAALGAEIRRIRRLEAARLYAALELHAGGASAAVAARELAGFAHLDAESAAYEARLALLDPLRGIGYLGYLELLAAEEALAAETSPELALWWVARLVQLSPSAPIRASVARFADLEPLLGPEAPEIPEAPEASDGPTEPQAPPPGPQEGGEGR